MRGILLHTFYSVKRDRLITGLIVSVIFVSFIAAFLGSTAMTEPNEMRIIYAAASARFVSMIGIMVFISFHMKKLFENKEIDVMLSRIPSRTSIVISFVTSFILVGDAISFATTLIMGFVYMQNLVNILYWGMTLALESIIVVAFTTFFSIVMRSPSLGMLMTFATYFIGRVIGNFVAYIDLSRVHASFVYAAEVFIKIISVIMPRLDLFGKTEIIVYGAYDLKSSGIMLFQAILYSVFITFLGILEMQRKEF